MSRSGFKAHAVDASGAVLTSASVTVRDQSGVVISPSALFTAYSGTGTHASNPFTATGGLISFYVEGSQVVTVSAVSGGTSQTWSNVVLNELIDTTNFATSSQGAKADTATQPADLGTAAATDSTDYATSAQGTLADSALQAADVGTAAAQDSTAFATAAQGTLADSALQAADITGKADLVGGVIPNSQLPSLAITEYLGAAANQAALLALSGQRGDWATRTDLGTTFILTSDGGSSIGDWTEIATPADAVSSVNGNTGAIVLDASDVGAATAAQGALADSATQPADLGTAAAADLTTSATDTTAGRVLRVGDGGINSSNLTSLSDAHSLMGAGFYQGAGASAANYPSTSAAYSPQILSRRGSARQSLFSFGAEAHVTYTVSGSTFNSYEFWTTSNLTKGTNPTDVPTNADLGTAAAADTGTGATDVPTNADLGTAAQADLTTSATDTTTGRVLKVGDWGIGTGNGPTITDFNSYYDSGFYRGVGGSATNASAIEDGYLPSIVSARNGDRSIFTWGVKSSGAMTASIYHRRANATNYSAQLWTTGNYQPETSLGLGVARKMKNKSGGAIADQAQVAGSSLKAVYTDSSGVEQENPATIGGTWINVSGMSIGNNEAAEFTKL